MCKIIQFPKTKRSADFYKFLVRWSDGAIFMGDSIEECFRRQKDAFEPECSMEEYLERFRERLENVNNTYYSYTDVAGLVEVLVDNDYLEVLEREDLERSSKNTK